MSEVIAYETPDGLLADWGYDELRYSMAKFCSEMAFLTGDRVKPEWDPYITPPHR